MAFDPRGRSSCREGRINSIAGIGISSIDGRGSFAAPCRPSIHSTRARTQSGSSDQGTPDEVTPPEPATRPSDLHLDIKKPSAGFPRRADIRATGFVAEVAASPCGNHLAQAWQVGEGVSPTLDAKSHMRFLSSEIQCRDTRQRNHFSYILPNAQHQLPTLR